MKFETLISDYKSGKMISMLTCVLDGVCTLGSENISIISLAPNSLVRVKKMTFWML